jgi:DMSO reductase anchor subunit
VAGFVLPEMKWVTFLLGLGLIYCMAKIYQLRTMPVWNTWRTMAGFFITSILLGCLAMINMLKIESVFAWDMVAVLLMGELGLTLSTKDKTRETVNRLRVGLIACAIVGAAILSVAPNPLGVWTSLPIFLIVLIEEIVGRWIFYEALQERAI